MSISQDYLDFLLDRLSAVGRVSARRMFGGVGFYHGGRMFALSDGEELYLKADDVNRPVYVKREMPPFIPFPDKPDSPSLSYYGVSADDLEDDGTLRDLARLAISASKRQAKKKKPAAKKKPKGS